MQRAFKDIAAVAGALLLLGAVLQGCVADDGAGDAAQETLTVKAAFATPAQVGQNTLNITVRDAEGAPVAGAAVTVDPQMPTHGHGSTETPVVKDEGGGAYTAAPVTLQMAGPWVVTVVATLGEDRGTVRLDVEL